MRIVRQPVRTVDEIEYKHFETYGQSSYGISPEELQGFSVEMGSERVWLAEEHSYTEDFYYDLIVGDELVGKVFLLKLARVYQVDLMVFDPYKGRGYATEGLRLALADSKVAERHIVRAGVAETSPHREAAIRVLEHNGFVERNGQYYLNFKRRYVMNR